MPRHRLIKLTKTKHKERILKAEKEKQQVTYKGNPIHLTADLSAETEKEKYTTKTTVPRKDLIQDLWRNKKNSRQTKVKSLQHQQTSFTTKVQFSSVAQSCPTLCNPMNSSTPGLPVHHQLLEFTQIHVYLVMMLPNHLILCRHFLLPHSIFPSIKVFSK